MKEEGNEVEGSESAAGKIRQPTVRQVIFVAGAHGTGKTTFSKELSRFLNIPFYSAGSLITAQREQAERGEKSVVNVQTNQDELVNAVASLDSPHPYIILDGHFCVHDTAGAIRRIPFETYVGLNLKIAFILTDSPEEIYGRRMLRDGRSPAIDEIRELQIAEKEHGIAVAESMGISIHLIPTSALEVAISLVQAETQKGGGK